MTKLPAAFVARSRPAHDASKGLQCSISVFDAGAVLDVVEKTRDAVLQQISHFGLKPDHDFRRSGRRGWGIAGGGAELARSTPRPVVTAVAAREAVFTKSLREIAVLSFIDGAFRFKIHGDVFAFATSTAKA